VFLAQTLVLFARFSVEIRFQLFIGATPRSQHLTRARCVQDVHSAGAIMRAIFHARVRGLVVHPDQKAAAEILLAPSPARREPFVSDGVISPLADRVRIFSRALFADLCGGTITPRSITS